MKKVILGVAGIFLLSFLFFQCSEDSNISNIGEIEVRDTKETDDFALVKCKKGSSKCQKIDMTGISPSGLEGLSVEKFLDKIKWQNREKLCKGGCGPGVKCLPTSIESSGGGLTFETDNDDEKKISKGVKKTQSGAIIEICIQADACKC